MFLILYVHTSLPETKWVISNNTLEGGLPDKLGLDLIPHSYSIRHFMNSRRNNSDPWSYVILVGQGYLVRHVVSTKLVMVIAHFSQYCVI